MRQLAGSVRHIARRQRLRLWLGDLLGHAHWPGGWAALILLTGGIVHQAFLPVAAPTVLLLAGLPALLYVAWTFHRRPSLAEAVTQTDLRLEAHALFITVWESAAVTPARTGLPAALTARAERQLPQWRERLDNRPFPTPGTPLFLTLGLVAIGCLLLLLPGKPLPLKPAAERTQVAEERTEAMPDPVALINAALLQEKPQAAPVTRPDARNAVAKAAPQPPHPDASSAEKSASPLSDFATNLQTRQVDRDIEPTEDALPVKTARTEPDRSGSQAGSDEANAATADPLSTLPFLQSQAIEIELPETASQGASDRQQGGLLIPATASRLSARVERAGQLEAGSQAALHRLSLAQRTLVKQYFEQLSHSDESTP